MPTKKTIIRKLENQVVNQEKKEPDIEVYEKVAEKNLDVTKAPGIDAEEKLKENWKHQELEHELKEDEEVTNESLDIEKEEEKGENPYPEIEESISNEADEEEEVEEEKEDKEKEKED